MSEYSVIPDTNGQQIRTALLPSVVALRAAFAARFQKPLEVVEGLRTRQRQQELYDGWIKKLPGFNLAAPPGTSLHETGNAIDFGSNVNVYGSPEKNWMDTNAPKYGWNPTGNLFSPREPWHYTGGGIVTASLNNTGGFLMALNDQQQNDLASQVKFIFDQIKVPDAPFGYLSPMNDKLDGINAHLAEIKTLLDNIHEALQAKDPNGTEYGFEWLPAINNNIAGLYKLLGK